MYRLGWHLRNQHTSYWLVSEGLVPAPWLAIRNWTLFKIIKTQQWRSLQLCGLSEKQRLRLRKCNSRVCSHFHVFEKFVVKYTFNFIFNMDHLSILFCVHGLTEISSHHHLWCSSFVLGDRQRTSELTLSKFSSLLLSAFCQNHTFLQFLQELYRLQGRTSNSYKKYPLTNQPHTFLVLLWLLGHH